MHLHSRFKLWAIHASALQSTSSRNFPLAVNKVISNLIFSCLSETNFGETVSVFTNPLEMQLALKIKDCVADTEIVAPSQ